jgi:serine/threonine-protein kinase
MLAGEPPFTGPSAQAITARKLTETAPRISVVRDTVPPAVDETLKKALARLPADRFNSARDFSDALARASGGAVTTPGLWQRLGARRRFSVPAWGIWAVVVVLIALLAWGVLARRSLGMRSDSPLAVLSIPLTGNLIGGITGNLVAISPDSRYIVWVTPLSSGRPNLRLRRIDQFDVMPIGDPGMHPFFSPDAQWLGFFTGGQLARTPIAGGPVLPIAPAQGLIRGATWGEDFIVYAAGEERGLMLVPDSGGAPTRLTVPDTANGVVDHRWPEMLPDDRGVLFTISSR